MYRLCILFLIAVICFSCGTIKIKKYPEHWPKLNNDFNISGIYSNRCSESTFESKVTLFQFLLSSYELGTYKDYTTEKNHKIPESLYAEINNERNRVIIRQSEKAVTVMLYKQKRLLKKITFHHYEHDHGKIILRSRYAMSGEVLVSYTSELQKSADGSLVASIQTTMTYGWFLESTDRYNNWIRWGKVFFNDR